MNDQVPAELIEALRQTDGGLTVLPDGSGVFLDIGGHQVLSLSKTGVALVQQVQAGTDSLDALASSLESRFDVSYAEALIDVQEFIGELSRALCEPTR